MLHFKFLNSDGELVAEPSMPIAAEALRGTYFASHYRFGGAGVNDSEINVYSPIFTPWQGVAVVEALQRRWMEQQEQIVLHSDIFDFLQLPSDLFQKPKPLTPVERAHAMLRRAMQRWAWLRLTNAHSEKRAGEKMMYGKPINSLFKVEICEEREISLEHHFDHILRIVWHNMDGSEDDWPRLVTSSGEILIEKFKGTFAPHAFPLGLCVYYNVSLQFQRARPRYFISMGQIMKSADLRRYIRSTDGWLWKSSFRQHGIVYMTKFAAFRLIIDHDPNDTCRGRACICRSSTNTRRFQHYRPLELLNLKER